MTKIHHESRTREFWSKQDFYKQSFFRTQKCARIVNSIARGRNCDLLDVGCGPATLSTLLENNINYYGIDWFIHEPAPNLIETDLLKNEIKFEGKQFDIIVAAGFFEHMADLQDKKLSEIELLLKKHGKFITTFTNFSHIYRVKLPSCSNIRSIVDFRRNLSLLFVVEEYFPSSHNWRPTELRSTILNKVQMYLNVRIPIFSHLFAVNVFFVCSRK